METLAQAAGLAVPAALCACLSPLHKGPCEGSHHGGRLGDLVDALKGPGGKTLGPGHHAEGAVFHDPHEQVQYTRKAVQVGREAGDRAANPVTPQLREAHKGQTARQVAEHWLSTRGGADHTPRTSLGPAVNAYIDAAYHKKSTYKRPDYGPEL